MRVIVICIGNMRVCYNGRITYFGGKVNIYVVIDRSKDKNTTQDNLAELVGSPVAPVWCK